MAAGDDRGYLRSPVEMDSSQRFQPTCRPLLYGTLAIMGLLQIASSVAILLHLTGHIDQVLPCCATKKEMPAEFTSLGQKAYESMQTGGVIADALKDPRKKERSKCCKPTKDQTPAAHLTIRAPINFTQKGNIQQTLVHWNPSHGLSHIRHLGYTDGKLKVIEGGLYYIYAKTCFRHYPSISEDSLKDDTQLLQYIHHEKQAQKTTIILMKSGSTKSWNETEGFYLYCVQQGGIFLLKSGDGLFVKVSNSWLLDPESEGSYFGAFKISNLN
ncbi:tumor necrosis factor ligand superfamily member 11 [Amia ocellicauda]|uniref:tumor necrosis factor ligand superfamily member 11 n=1 Tax=Amia ocellicauda TaxID=2972642 RepID=UPI0034646A38